MPEPFKVTVNPEVLEDLNKLPPEVREAFLHAMEEMRRNPYTATPLSRNPLVHLLNRWRRWRRNVALRKEEHHA